MRSKKVSVQVPWPVVPILEEHAKEVGYQNVSQLLLWAAIYSLIVRKPHTLTAALANMPPEIQDEYLADIIAAYEKGESKRGSMLGAILSDLVKKFKLPIPPEVLESMVADTVKQRPKRGIRQ